MVMGMEFVESCMSYGRCSKLFKNCSVKSCDKIHLVAAAAQPLWTSTAVWSYPTAALRLQ